MDNTFEASKGEVHIGETSDFLVNELGAESLDMLMPANKAYASMVSEETAIKEGRYDKDLHYHELGKDKLLEALKKAENPIVAFASDVDLETGEKREDRIVLVTEAKHNGNHIVIVNGVSSDGVLEGKRIKANATITVFDRKFIANHIRDARIQNRILFVDKKRSQQLVSGEEGQTLNSLNKSDFDNNIKQFWDIVNYKKSKKAKSESIGNYALKDAIEKAMNGDKSSPRHSIADNYLE